MARRYVVKIDNVAHSAADLVAYVCCPPIPGGSSVEGKITVKQMSLSIGNATSAAAQMVQLYWGTYSASGLSLPTGGTTGAVYKVLPGDANATFQWGYGPFSAGPSGSVLSYTWESSKYAYLGWDRDDLNGGIELCGGQLALLGIQTAPIGTINFYGTIVIEENF